MSFNEKELVIINGCICCNTALYPTLPDCIGCSSKGECCCLVEETCLKAGAEPLTCNKPQGYYCQIGLFCCSIACKPPTTCVKAQGQFCCFVNQTALPPDNEVPCTCSFCFLNCYPSAGCCQTLGAMLGEPGHQAMKD